MRSANRPLCAPLRTQAGLHEKFCALAAMAPDLESSRIATDMETEEAEQAKPITEWLRDFAPCIENAKAQMSPQSRAIRSSAAWRRKLSALPTH